MSKQKLIRNSSFRCFDRENEIGFIITASKECFMLKGESEKIARATWSITAAPCTEDDLLSKLLQRGFSKESAVSTLRRLIDNNIIFYAERELIDQLLSPYKSEWVCDNLVVCMTGAVQTGNMGMYLRQLKMNFCKEIKIVVTESARKLIQPKFFQHYLASEIYGEVFGDFIGVNGVPHIWLSNWASCLLVAPASAASIHRIAHGTCDDLLSLTVTAMPKEKPVVIGPSMNTRMWVNPAVQRNLDLCRERGYWIIEPGYGVEVNQDWDDRVPIDGILGAESSEIAPIMANIFDLYMEGDD